ncbi:acyl-CoA N-acyltransferase [Rostrohypoxylon terebratum]|nr:acyl-CoA N-acyltransferase [Rostrohypoxylon terebratum]
MAGKVTLATPDDIPDLVEIFWEAFSGPGEVVFPHTCGGRKWLERSFENFLNQKSYYRPASKVAVVRNLNSRPVALVILHVVHPGQSISGEAWKTRWTRCEDIPGMSEQKLAEFFEPLSRAHYLVVGNKGHAFIELIMTKPSSRGRGYASALMEWATKLADGLGIPCYLDAGMRGMGICDRYGFKAQNIEVRYGGPPPCTPMLRTKK